MRKQPIIVTKVDARKLGALLRSHTEAALRDQEHLQELKTELERALVVDGAHVTADFVTMHARVQILDLSNGHREQYTLSYPAEANVSERRISVLAPLGTALLGYREGDEVEWEMPGGLRRLLIERVFQTATTFHRPVAPGALVQMVAPGIH